MDGKKVKTMRYVLNSVKEYIKDDKSKIFMEGCISLWAKRSDFDIPWTEWMEERHNIQVELEPHYLTTFGTVTTETCALRVALWSVRSFDEWEDPLDRAIYWTGKAKASSYWDKKEKQFVEQEWVDRLKIEDAKLRQEILELTKYKQAAVSV